MMRYIKLAICFFLFNLIISPVIYGQITLKIVIANPFDHEEEFPVKYYLPRGLSKEDILDTGGLDFDYDPQQGAYYLLGKVKLAAKESKNIQVRIKDIWKIPEEEFLSIKKIIDEKIKNLKENGNNELAELIEKRVKQRIDSLENKQQAIEADVEKRMQLYKQFKLELQRIKDDLFSLSTGIEQEETQTNQDTVTLVIEMENVTDYPLEYPVKYYLPKEIREQDIINSPNLEVNYDFKKDNFYLEGKVELKPHEKKVLSATIRNIWKIPEPQINRYVKEAKQILEKIGDSPVKDMANILMNEINKKTATIIKNQNQAATIKESISIYHKNEEILDEVKDDLDKLRTLLINEQQKLMASNERKEGGKQGVRQMFKPKEEENPLKRITNALFKFKLKQGTVWKIIMTIVIFIIILTSVFYGIWIIQLNKESKKKYKKIGK